MVLLKLLSLFIKTFQLINLEYITMLMDLLLVVMQSKLLVGVLKMVQIIGKLPTHGTKTGETMDSSKLREEIMNVELKAKSLQEFQNSHPLNHQSLKNDLNPLNNRYMHNNYITSINFVYDNLENIRKIWTIIQKIKVF